MLGLLSSTKYLGGEVLSHDGADVDQLNSKVSNHTGTVCKADHVVLHAPLIITVAAHH